MTLRVGFGMVAAAVLLLVGGAVAAEPENTEAFRAERERQISPANPHGYQPIIDYNKPKIDPYTEELERQRRNGFRPEGNLIDLDALFGRARR